MNILCLTTENSYSSHRKHVCHINGEKNEEVSQFQRLIIGQKYTKSDDRIYILSTLLLNDISLSLSVILFTGDMYGEGNMDWN